MHITLLKRKSYTFVSLIKARTYDYAVLLHAKVHFKTCMCSYSYTTNVGGYLKAFIEDATLSVPTKLRNETARMRAYEIRWSYVIGWI